MQFSQFIYFFYQADKYHQKAWCLDNPEINLHLVDSPIHLQHDSCSRQTPDGLANKADHVFLNIWQQI